MIKLEDVSLTLEGGSRILDGISLTIRKNEHWVLAGRNGSGKSKLLEIICGYTRQSTGRVVRFGDESPDLREIRRRIGYVASYLKSHIAFYDSVLDIVTGGYFGSIGLYDQTSAVLEERAGGLLHLMGLDGFEDRLFATLSDGEKQRALSARAFMIEPEIVIFDEPTAGLDILSREILLESLQSVVSATGASLIYVTHHVEEITSLFTHFALLQKGRLLHAGPLRDDELAARFGSLFDNRVVIAREEGRWYSRIAQ